MVYNELNTHDQFISHFPDAKSCKLYILNNIYNGMKLCPYCGYNKTYILKEEKNNPYGRIKCANNKCYKRFTILTGTQIHACKIPLDKLFYLFWLYAKQNNSSYEESLITGITQKITSFRKYKISSILKALNGSNKNTHEIFNTILNTILVHDKTKITRLKK